MHSRGTHACGIAFALLLALSACTQGTPASPRGADQALTRSEASPVSSRTLVSAIRIEPSSLSTRPPLRAGAGQAQFLVQALFNADLANLDEQDVARPSLAETLPQLNTPSWEIYPDGRMRTLYALRPNVTWHDGAPLTASDWVFAWQLFSNPQLDYITQPPFNQIESVAAPDARTVEITWKVPYFDAGSLTAYNGGFPALPRHILQSALEQDAAEPLTISNWAYWGREFVGLGPYRLERWESGIHLGAVAFEGFARGRPKIGKIEVRFIPDTNTALSVLRSGGLTLATDGVLGVRQALDVRRDWQTSNGGTVVMVPSQWRAVRFQFRPDLADPAATLDVRVRKALAHALDKQSLVDNLYDGQELPADTFVAPKSVHGRAAEQAVIKYTFDPRVTEQLMAEAGFTRRADGFYANAAGRFSPEVRINASAEFEVERNALASGWRELGFDVQEASNPPALAQDPRSRNEYRSMFVNSTTATTDADLPNFINQGNWSDPEYDRLATALRITPDLQQRQGIMAQLVRYYSEVLPTISLRFASHPWAFTPDFVGFQIGGSEHSVGWHVPNWELKER